MAEIREVDHEGNIVNTTSDKQEVVSKNNDVLSGNEDFMYDIALSQVLNLDNHDIKQYKDKLADIMTWVKTQTEDLSFENVKRIIVSLKSKLGSPKWDEKLISQVHRYAYLSMQSKKVQSEIEELLA